MMYFFFCMGFLTLSLVLREVHEWRINKQMVLRTIFGFKRKEVGGYRNGIMGRFIICTVHEMEASICDQIKMIEIAGTHSTQVTEGWCIQGFDRKPEKKILILKSLK